MPSGIAASVRMMFAQVDKTDLVVQKSPCSATGYTNIIITKNGKYQPRLQVKGDGRGGERKRKQCSLPGIFDTALEAAQYLAWIKMQPNDWENGVPPKQNDERKARSKKQPTQPLQPTAVPAPLQTPMATAVGMPIPMPMCHLPFAATSPLPMQPLGYVPPRF